MCTWMSLSFQDSVSPLMEQLIMFHDHVMMIIIFITLIVFYMMFSLYLSLYVNRNLLEGQFIEFVWTIIPAVMLIFIALPSLRILYLIEEVNNPLLTIKGVGHQWYWSYEYSDFCQIDFDSFMSSYEDSSFNTFRLLDVDNRIVIPFGVQVRFLVSSFDVIHSWTVPSLGLKLDALPGRVNQGLIYLMRPGLFFGQCSEICGSNHSFMPIVLESINVSMFMNWLSNF
uniref:Cytochrome c oxidase subunit 2 n=1 Tax=Petalocephala chlorophana TaxID=2501810 RepID=A0A7L8XG71_9HEMI|nr:cytochrome c oxidase subunit II [Petalocephala chlorophana]QOH91201.1 cytochrome c oxidase subunit II [Petalocephala chlorophana]